MGLATPSDGGPLDPRPSTLAGVLTRLRQGERTDPAVERRLNEVFGRYETRVLSVCRRELRGFSEAQIEEVAQDVLLEGWRRILEYDSDRGPASRAARARSMIAVPRVTVGHPAAHRPGYGPGGGAGMWMFLAGSAAMAGGTLDVASLSVDGLELRDLSCTLQQQVLLGPITVAAALASQKTALDACGPTGQAFRVAFDWADQAKVTVEAGTGNTAASTCVTKALTAVAPPVSGRCVVVVLTGPKDAAEVARAKLSAAGALPPKP